MTNHKIVNRSDEEPDECDKEFHGKQHQFGDPDFFNASELELLGFFAQNKGQCENRNVNQKGEDNNRSHQGHIIQVKSESQQHEELD